jgi:hypothetical protein
VYGELYYLFQSDCFVAKLALVFCMQASRFHRDEFQGNDPGKSSFLMQFQTRKK